MNQSQQSALEALIGRVLTAGEVTAITPWVDARRDDMIEAVLNAGRTRYAETRKVEIGVIGAYPGGPLEADALLAKLEAHADAGLPLSRLVGRALRAMAVEPGLNFGDPATHGMLDALAAAGVITSAEAANLKSIASVPDPISRDVISRALNKAEAT